MSIDLPESPTVLAPALAPTPDLSEIVSSVFGRTRSAAHAYHEYRRTSGNLCAFCPGSDAVNDDVVDRLDTMLVIRNLFPYAVWESIPVLEHLMIVPARHVLSLDEYTDREGTDFFLLLRRYEAAGYSIYSRAPTNHTRSVGHVHTHLLLTRPPPR